MSRNNDVGLGERLLDLTHNQRDRAGDLCQRVSQLKKNTDLSDATIAAIINEKLPENQQVTASQVDGMSKGYEISRSLIPLSAKTTRALIADQQALNVNGLKVG